MSVPSSEASVQEHHRLHYINQARLPMWTVYRPTTADHPGQWLARMFFVLPDVKPTMTVVFGATLQAVRDQLPLGLTRIERNPQDDVVIEEIWL